jgi:uncharacterized protein YoxC
MDLYIQISIIVITVAIVILMYFLIQTMKVLKAALEEVRLTVGELRSDVSQISVDVKEMIHNTNEMTLDVRTKLRSLDILFATVNDVGQAVHSFTTVMKESAASLVTTIKGKEQHEVYDSNPVHSQKTKTISAVTDGIMSSIRIWRKLKNN